MQEIENNEPTGIAEYGDYLWVVDSLKDRVYKYQPDKNNEYYFEGNYTTAGYYNLTVVIADSGYSYTYEWNLTIGNTNNPPSIKTILISPSQPLLEDVLNCGLMAEDADENNLTANITWFRNGQHWTEDNEENLAIVNGQMTNTSYLGDIEGNDTTENDEWICSANVYDGEDWGGWTNSSPAYVNRSIVVTSCQILNSPNTIYGLANSVSANGTCFNITAQNVTLDGRGYTIDYGKAIDGFGIYGNGFNKITIMNLVIEMNNESRKNSRGIYIRNSKENNITDNIMHIEGANMADSWNNGIEFKNTSDSYITNNEIYVSNQKGYGIYLEASYKEKSDNNSIENNIIYTDRTYEYGIRAWGVNDGTAKSSYISKNAISTLNSGSYGILLDSVTDNSIIVNNVIRTPVSYGIYVASSNNQFMHNNISSSGSYDVYVSSGTNNTFLNVTYTDETVSSGQLIRKWYLDAQVNYTNGTATSQANVTGKNVSGAEQFSELTNLNGKISTKELIEYINNAGNKTYYTNYTLTAKKDSYADSSQLVNLNQNKNILLTLYLFPNDTNKFYHKNSSGNAVAWLGDSGNIVLKGKCYFGGSCDNPGDNSIIFRNSSDANVAFINETGDLCIRTGDCSAHSANCTNSGDNSFIIQNSTSNMIYISEQGDLCLTGNLYQNSNP
jgi:hypothetical protein